MRVENNVLILERKDCRCRDGTEPTQEYRDCPKCGGSGRRGGGNCRECRGSGAVTFWDQENRRVCHVCKGNFKDFLPESYYDLGFDCRNLLPVVVLRKDRPHTWMEHNLGFGLGSCTDYGRHKNLTDEQLIEDVKHSYMRSTQAIKVIKSKEEPVLANRILIITSDQGYSVVADFEG